VEYVVLLALVAILAVTIVAGIGRRSSQRIAQANDALEEAAIATATGAGGPKTGGASGGPRGNNGNHNGWGQGVGGGRDHNQP
jgi:Flp pilus assembly pilin Flp